MVYVVLLRGINVGGKNKIEMLRLKQICESLGCGSVKTYINSGNVILSDNRSAEVLSEMIESAIQKEFSLSIKVVIRSQTEISELCSHIPAKWTNDNAQKTDVIFLHKNIDNPRILEEIVFKPDIENVKYAAHALIWNLDRQNATKSSASKLIMSPNYAYMTVRNVNTVRKLNNLMTEIDS